MPRRIGSVLIVLAALSGASAHAQIAGGLRLEGVGTCAELSSFIARNPGFDSAMVAGKRDDLGGCAPVPAPRVQPRPVAPARPAPVPRATPPGPAPAPRVRPAVPRPAVTSPAIPSPAIPRIAPVIVSPPTPRLTPRLNAPSLTPRLNTLPDATGGLAGGATRTLNAAPEVVALTHAAPDHCRWATASGSPVLECLNENAVWHRIEDANITVGTVDAAARGDALAMANLGYFYDVQPAPVRDRAEALRLYRGASDQGVAIARYNLAVLYRSGVPGVIDPDPAESRRSLLQAADQGLAIAMRALAEQAGKSGGDLSKGQWYLRAAEAGDVPSMGKAAEFYRTGDGGLGQDAAAALDWARQADAHGDAWGRYVLGLCFEAGDGELAPDPAEAYRLFRLAADAGVTPAMGKVGEYLYQGWGGVARDDREALTWLARAGDAGDPRSEYYLALFHLDGLAGLAPDPVAAAALMLTSAQAGDVRAMFRTGRNFEIGIGTAPDLFEARRWYRQAAQAGDPDARERLDVLGPY